jgi:hypothetical protein
MTLRRPSTRISSYLGVSISTPPFQWKVFCRSLVIFQPPYLSDFFLPLLFEVRSLSGQPTLDLLSKLRRNIQLVSEDVAISLPIEPQIIAEANSNKIHTFIRAMSFANHEHMPHLVTEY